jgi:hypothetical protein
VADFFLEGVPVRTELTRLSREEADAMRRPRADVISREVYSYLRPAGESPLDDLLEELRKTASPPHVGEALDTGEYAREPELTDEELCEVSSKGAATVETGLRRRSLCLDRPEETN